MTYLQDTLALKFKLQLRDQQALLKERELEIEQLRKNIRSTKIEELETELMTLYKEASKMKSLLNQTKNQLDSVQNQKVRLSERLRQKNHLIAKLKKEKDMMPRISYSS